MVDANVNVLHVVVRQLGDIAKAARGRFEEEEKRLRALLPAKPRSTPRHVARMMRRGKPKSRRPTKRLCWRPTLPYATRINFSPTPGCYQAKPRYRPL